MSNSLAQIIDSIYEITCSKKLSSRNPLKFVNKIDFFKVSNFWIILKFTNWIACFWKMKFLQNDSINGITWQFSSFHSSSSLLKKLTCRNSTHSIKKSIFRNFKAWIICLEKLKLLINWFCLWGNLMYFKVQSFLAWIVYLQKLKLFTNWFILWTILKYFKVS